MTSSIFVKGVIHTFVSKDVKVSAFDKCPEYLTAEFLQIFSENYSAITLRFAIDPLNSCAMNRLDKTSSKIFTEESINKWVQHAVGVT